MNQHAKLFLEDFRILRDVTTVTKNIYIALCFYFKLEENEGYRTRTTKVGLKHISDLTNYSYGSVKRGIQELKRVHYIIDGEKKYIYSFEKRFGRSRLITSQYPIDSEIEFKVDPKPKKESKEGTHVKPTVGSEVKPSMGLHVKPKEGTHVKPSKGLHVKPSINKNKNNNNNNSINNNYNFTDKQKYILDKFIKQFGWDDNPNWENELSSQIPDYSIEYFDNALMYIGIWNYHRQLDSNRQWTPNYWIKGVVAWLKRGKPPKRPTVEQERWASRLHAEVIKFEKPKQIIKPDLKIVKTTLDDMANDCIRRHKEDPNWGTDMMLKSYLKSDLVSEDIKNQIREIS